MKVISIIGNANVGKSTLFNKCVTSSERAITSDYAGTTRDYKAAAGKLFDLEFKLVDTAGLSSKICSEKDLRGKTDNQTLTAISKSDIILFVVDGTVGITEKDKSIAAWLKKKNLSAIVVINKIDVKQTEDNVHEFHQLGFNTICKISAEHSLGLNSLYELIRDTIKSSPLQNSINLNQEENKNIKIAIIGRPNVGKSTLINAFLNEERVITSEEAGTTRDSILIDIKHNNNQIQLIDTAGVRKRKNIADKVEKLSVKKSIEAIRACDVAVLTIDIKDILRKQDLKLANIATQEELKPLIIAINKIDSVKTDQDFLNRVSNFINTKLPQLSKIKIVYISALKKKNINKILDECISLYKLWNIKISTSKLNKWLEQALEKHQPSLSKLGRRIKIKFISQIGSSPLRFQIFSNHAQEISDQYLRYLINSLQNHFKLYSVPVKLHKIKPKNPYKSTR